MVNENKIFEVDEVARLDNFLSKKLSQTRNQVVQLIKQSAVHVEEKPVIKSGLKLKVGQIIRVEFPEPKVTIPQEIDFDVEVIYEDEDILVINKPSGLTVHSAPSVKEPTLVDWLKHKGITLSTISGEERHGIVHRLDKGTSGVMVIAKNNAAHESLSLQLQDRSMGRYYIAIINPLLKDDITTVEKPIARSSSNRLKMVISENGKYAKTEFKKFLQSNDEKSEIVLCKLYSGRTHQIRVHLESISRHIIGDHLYGTSLAKKSVERILLHANTLYLVHPRTKKRCEFSASIDNYMREYLKEHFNYEEFENKINTSGLGEYFINDAL